jgi:lysophospholipase L1-like esterase
MDTVRNVAIFGDSILRGIQLDSETSRYCVHNTINMEQISNKYSVLIDNFSMFGCTIKKGYERLQKRLEKQLFNIAVIEYGGNDCDFNWQEISDQPYSHHIPNTPLDIFACTYRQIIGTLKAKCIEPLLITLPPLEPQKFFDWFCRDLNKANILKWLGSVNTIYRFQESYSKMIETIARETKTRLVDLRGAFLDHFHIENLLCEDGTHPNTDGQKVITDAFLNFSTERVI